MSNALLYSFRENVVVEHSAENTTKITWSHPARSPLVVSFPKITAGMQQALTQLTSGHASKKALLNSVIKQDGLLGVGGFYKQFATLERFQLLRFSAEINQSLALNLLPDSRNFKFDDTSINVEQPYILSRFAHMRRNGDGMEIQSPTGFATIQLDSPLAIQLIYALGQPSSATELNRTLGIQCEQLCNCLILLRNANVIAQADVTGAAEETDALRQWEYHDLIHHAYARSGRTFAAKGKTYRHVKEISAPDVLKKSPAGERIDLYEPDLAALSISLNDALEQRRSEWRHGAEPISLEQVGEFLYRTARVKEVMRYKNEGGVENPMVVTKRPYPSGGARYGLEIYLTVGACAGLEPGFYYYQPQEHALYKISDSTRWTEQILQNGSPGYLREDRPQILVTIAARFQRVAWAYEGVAYALLLKECGVLTQNMYLVATAMNLAACAIGGGDADLFAKVAGTDYYEESCIGEFALGSRPIS